MVYVVHRGHDHAAVRKLGMYVHVLLRGYGPQQPHGVHGHLLHVHGFLFHHNTVVKPRQIQQLFRGALQPVGLGADVGDEFPHGALVHIGVLHDAVRQKSNGCQRGLQLVRGVGHKLPALLFRGLQPLGQGVELLPQLRHLVVAGDGEAVAVIPVGHYAYGAHQGAYALCEQLGHEGVYQKRHGAYGKGNIAYSVLYADDKLGLLGVVFVYIHCPRRALAGLDGHGRAAGKGAVSKPGIEHRFALQGGGHGVKISRLAHKVIFGGRVVDRRAGGVRHHDAVVGVEVQQVHDL